MMPVIMFLSVFVVLLGMSVPAACQSVPRGYQVSGPAAKRCDTRPSERPITRTVEVDLPVPCLPDRLMGPMVCPPHPCCPPPPCPTRPLQVRVDVVVRPEGPRPCPPPKFVCENPPIFEPIFYHAAGMICSMVAAPLWAGERLMGHGGPVCYPIPPYPPPIAMGPPSFQPPPAYAALRMPPAIPCMAPCPPAVGYVPHGPRFGAQPVCGPGTAWKHPRGAPFPR